MELVFQHCAPKFNHERYQQIYRSIENCTVCRNENKCLIFDSSDAEYQPIAICYDCFDRNLYD